jgi:hypothetical protein
MNKCSYEFKSGKRKDEACGEPCQESFCDKHKARKSTVKSEFKTALSNNHDSLESLFQKFKMLDTTNENKSVIEKKIRYLANLKPSSNEYTKNIAWLKHALNLPYKKFIELSVQCPPMDLTISKQSKLIDLEPPISTADYIADVHEKLNSYVWGMDRVKEQVLSFVCKRISNSNSTDHVLALQGGYGVGKCFARDTDVLMYDGSTKKVQDVRCGDVLMGDDETPRHVYTLGEGFDELYRIQHINTNVSYTVNGDHILVLKNKHKEMIELTVNNFLRLCTSQQKDLYGYTKAIKNRPSIYNVRYELRKEYVLKCIGMNSDIVTIPNNMRDSKYFEHLSSICTSVGFKSFYDENGFVIDTTKCHDEIFSNIKVTPIGKGHYYGFTIDGNERFVLGNFVVTHNTRLAKGLSQALDLPLKTINMGSVNDVSYFTGHGFTYVESEPGRIVQILNETQCSNCIIYFDELDKIHKTDKAQAINGFLTHLIDPMQSKSFQDVYLAGLELDLSKVFFVFSFNDLELVDKTVLDRLKVVHIPDPSYQDKIEITQRFIVPEICNNINLKVTFETDLIRQVVSSQKNKHGLRSIAHAFEEILNKFNILRMMKHEGRKKLSFYADTYSEIIDKTIKEIEEEVKDKSNCLHMYV